MTRHVAYSILCRTWWCVLPLGVFTACGGDGPTEPPLSARPENAGAALAVGRDHACGLAVDGAVYCWGWNDRLQLGTGTVETPLSFRNVPTRVATSVRFAAVTAGAFHTCGLDTAGTAHCWGNNEAGQLGIAPQSRGSNVPVAVSGGLTFRALSAGAAHTCGITPAGAASCWGSNAIGQLGDGTAGGPEAVSTAPVPVVGGHTWVSLSAGQGHTCGVRPDGRAFCWGANNWGQLGNGSEQRSSTTPVEVAGGRLWASISAGDFHTCGVTREGAGFCWGQGDSGQLGNGTQGSAGAVVAARTPVPVARNHAWAMMGPGRQHSCGVLASGAAYCWGYSTAGELGNGNTGDVAATPVAVSGGIAFAAVDGGSYFTCGLAQTGRIYCWGANNLGQLGAGLPRGQSVNTPAEVSGGLRFGL